MNVLRSWEMTEGLAAHAVKSIIVTNGPPREGQDGIYLHRPGGSQSDAENLALSR